MFSIMDRNFGQKHPDPQGGKKITKLYWFADKSRKWTSFHEEKQILAEVFTHVFNQCQGIEANETIMIHQGWW